MVDRTVLVEPAEDESRVAGPLISHVRRIELKNLKARIALPTDVAEALITNERLLLFCAASGTDWTKARIPGATVTTMMVKGLIVRDGAGQIVPTERGHAVLSPTFPTGPLILEFCRQNLNRIKGR